MGLVRYYLAFSVLMAHFNYVFQTDFYWPTSSYNAVGAFFGLSGFLVYSSYLKSKNWKQYLTRRAKRILPAYFFIVLLCAFGLFFVSSYSFKDYFLSPQWWKYLASNLCFLNFLEPDLPGVFTHNTFPAVNGSLWTMKIEWLLYISVPLVAWIIARCRNRIMLIIIIIYIFSSVYRIFFAHLYENTNQEIYAILGRQFLGQLMYFYTGVLIRFKLQGFIRYKWFILACCVLLLAFEPFIPYFKYIFSPALVTTLVIWFSMVGKWGVWASSNDNVSYDIYLFHMPILQLVSCLGLRQYIGDFLSLGLCVILTVILACISWFFIGKRFLMHHKKT